MVTKNIPAIETESEKAKRTDHYEIHAICILQKSTWMRDENFRIMGKFKMMQENPFL